PKTESGHTVKKGQAAEVGVQRPLWDFANGGPIHLVEHARIERRVFLHSNPYLLAVLVCCFVHFPVLLSCLLNPINGLCPSSSSHSNILPHPQHWRRFMLRRATSGLPQRGQGLPRGSSMTLLDHHVDRVAQLGPVGTVNPQIATARLGIHSADNDELASAFLIDPDL